MNYLNALRKYKQPLEYPSCGSVFKRPAGHYVGPMIIQAGLQGKQIGGAQDSTKHAGFIVNKGGATATDYLNLIHLIQKKSGQVLDLTYKQKLELLVSQMIKVLCLHIMGRRIYAKCWYPYFYLEHLFNNS